MSTLDELREGLAEGVAAAEGFGSNPLTKMYGDGFRDAMKRLDAFAAAHPGLTLVKCGQCCKELSGEDTLIMWSPDGWGYICFDCRQKWIADEGNDPCIWPGAKP